MDMRNKAFKEFDRLGQHAGKKLKYEIFIIFLISAQIGIALLVKDESHVRLSLKFLLLFILASGALVFKDELNKVIRIFKRFVNSINTGD